MIRSSAQREMCCMNPFGIDRDVITKELGSDGLIWKSMAGVSDRDFISETLQRAPCCQQEH